MKKINRIRKSQTCPKFCKEKGCYDKTEKVIIFGKKYVCWISYCKSLNKIHNKILKGG